MHEEGHIGKEKESKGEEGEVGKERKRKGGKKRKLRFQPHPLCSAGWGTEL